MSEKWNKGQLQAIENTDGNMIVSASAGSGKTAVMIERVKRLILERHVPVSRILMLSFNESIATEIKEKMAKTLIEEVKKADDKDFLRDQIDYLGMADITTMHSFCNSLIKEYFDIVGVDPAYSIMDDTESNVIINKCINEVFDEYFESGDVDFIVLKDKLSASSDDDLRSTVDKIFKFTSSLVGGEEWLDNTVENNYNRSLEKTKPACYIVSHLETLVNNAIDALQYAYNVIDIAKYSEIPAMLEHVSKYEHEQNILKFEDFKKGIVELPRRSLRNDNPDKPYYTSAKDTYLALCTACQKLYPVSFARMSDDHNSDRVVVAKLVEILKRFRTKYNKEKAEVNKLDFNDLEHYALEILSHDDIRNEVKSKYDYVCVDEYQDTNEVQNKILGYVSNGDNLFMVGDPKQSIYKFRFTEPEIFIDKFNAFKRSKENKAVELDANYRSSPLILDNINKVFDILMRNSRAGKIREAYSSLVNGLEFEDKILEPFEVMLYEVPRAATEVITEPSVYKVSENKGAISIKKDAEIEARYIATKVEKLLTEEIYDVKAGEYRKVRFDDMAILAQSRTDTVKMILEILEDEYKLPIDATYLKKKDEPQEVKILLDFLRCIDNPRQDIALYTTMKIFFDFEDSDFVAMKSEVGAVDFFHKIVYDDLLPKGKMKDKVDAFKETFDDYRLMSTFMDVHDFLIAAIEKSDFKKKLLMSDGGRVAIDNIDKFLMTLKDKKHCSTVQEFLYAYDNYNITNDIEATSQSVKNSIKTSTIHQSKGLEYPIVFLVNTGASFINTQASSRSPFLLDKELGLAIKTFDEKDKTVYSNWLMDAISMKKDQEETEEKFRLLYVAMTRAKNCLFITGKTSKKKASIEETHKFSDILYHIGEANSEFGEHIVYKSADEFDDVYVGAVTNHERAFNYVDYDSEDAKSYERVFDYKYPHEDATHISEKYTVTSINREERELDEYVRELYETEKTSIGSIYHKFMEHVNYEADTVDAIKAEMARMTSEKILTKEECENIVIDDVYKCMNSAIIKTAKVNRHEREKKFMMCLPMSEVKEGASHEKVIVQGIADLVIYGKKNILVDFKKSTLPPNMLREEYQKQLDIYAFALEKSMDITIDEMYLYVIGQDKIIDMRH